MNELTANVTALVTTICESFFDRPPAVLLGARGAPSGLWARVSIEGASAGDVWVSPSEGLACRILRSGFGATSTAASELREVTVELCNIVAGNIKALLPGPSRIGVPVFFERGPAVEAEGEQVFALGVDGEPLVVLLQLRP